MTNINIENLVHACSDKENLKNIPKNWMKCGEVFYDSIQKPVFVCLICLKNAESISASHTTHDGSVFWCHIQQQHISKECEVIDQISAEIESFENEMATGSTHFDFGANKLLQFHEHLVQSAAATEENLENSQSPDNRIENDEFEEINLPPGEKKIAAATECVTNLLDYICLYNENEVYMISDDEDEFDEEDKAIEPLRIVGNDVGEYLRHNDMIVLSDDDEDNVATRPNSPISNNEITKTNEEWEKTRVENNKYYNNDIGDNNTAQMNILKNLLTPDVSPCESVEATQYDKRYNPYDKDAQKKLANTADSSREQSLTEQQHNNSDIAYNQNSQENQVSSSDESVRESLNAQQSLTAEEYDKTHDSNDKDVEVTQAHIMDASPEQSPTPQECTDRNVIHNTNAPENQVPTPDLSPCAPLTPPQCNRNHTHKESAENQVHTPDFSPCTHSTLHQYYNENISCNKDAPQGQRCTPDAGSCQFLTAQQYNRSCFLSREKRVHSPYVPIDSIETQNKRRCSSQNQNLEEQRAPIPNVSPCESLSALPYNNRIFVCSENVQIQLHTTHVSTGGQQDNNRYAVQNDSSQKTRAYVPYGTPSGSLLPQPFNNVFNPYTENVQELRVHVPELSPPESLPAEHNNSYTAEQSISHNTQRKSDHQLWKTNTAFSRPFKCKYCGRRTISEANMEHHLKKFHQTEYQLEINRNYCSHYHQIPLSLQNGDPTSLESKAKRKASRIKCKICKTKTKTTKDMELHQKIFHSSETYLLTIQCPICNVRVLKGKLEKHKQLHCSFCQIVCKRKSSLAKHIRDSHADNITNTTPANLDQPEMSNVPNMPYQQQQFRHQDYDQLWRYHLNLNNVMPPQ